VTDSRSFPARPIVGVGGVVLDGNRVLLVKRAQAPLKGEWSLPGGAVDLGESLEAAVVREIQEETGLVVDIGPVVEVLDRIECASDGRVKYHYVIIDYLCHVRGGEAAPASDAADARWVQHEELDAYALTVAARAVIAKALRMRDLISST
jgi:8-oxo-dGTP diphosphatase